MGTSEAAAGTGLPDVKTAIAAVTVAAADWPAAAGRRTPPHAGRARRHGVGTR